jgi:hypothetical protein
MGRTSQVRINLHAAKQSFCLVLGVSEEAECFEVLALEMGDRERSKLRDGILLGVPIEG